MILSLRVFSRFSFATSHAINLSWHLETADLVLFSADFLSSLGLVRVVTLIVWYRGSSIRCYGPGHRDVLLLLPNFDCIWNGVVLLASGFLGEASLHFTSKCSDYEPCGEPVLIEGAG
uniref:Uncharacterized protein n=2 Tax=Opuntia streptacantha TaxID=393608 RepID=A0A7C9DGB7_OPUST